ncbi:MAG: ABC transporter substrate-binding protein [Deltaproteobacteria bacterium]|nr:ABC transporter substrate-binding protein [Deltaproteobacteria bacterium]MBW2394134.1 ABC transporter substrate-binding protein [Deltaproteobacteria bacterium]
MIHEQRPEGSPHRIVSLVPSLTEALFALGLGDRVVGVTEWCVHPAAEVASLPKLGGTKNPDLQALIALAPDLVIANREENRRKDVERMAEAGIPVWVTHPRSVAEGAELLAVMAGLGAEPDTVRRVVQPTLAAVALAEAEPVERPIPVFCPIWKGPWMSVGADTYAHDLLRLCGGANVFANRTDGRYPRVTEEEIVRAAPEVVLLPDEPYAFTDRDAQALGELPLPASRSGRIHVIDGTWVSWYGPRISRAVVTLRDLMATGG